VGGGQRALEEVGMNEQFWQGKRVLLTGHTGFKGSWLALWLQHLGADVVGFALAPHTQPNLFDAADVGRGMTSVIGDIRDLAALQQVVAQHQPEIILHLAAQAIVRESYTSPVETFGSNVMGTVHVLEAARLSDSVKVVVNVTSDKCYANREWVWGYREHEAMGGHDPYSSSKGCAELVTAAYRASYWQEGRSARPIATASARAGNVIGGGDWAKDRLVPDLIGALGRGEPLVVRNPNSVRPWQHVLEPLSGYLTLAERLHTDGHAFADGWNFGPSGDDVKPVRWIADHLTSLWGEGSSWGTDGGQHPHEARLLTLDSSKAREQLQWRPRWNIEQALQQTVAWQKAYLAGEPVHATTLAQILEYTRGHRG
jgi:CDP-glucose 4,6-dehydratase